MTEPDVCACGHDATDHGLSFGCVYCYCRSLTSDPCHVYCKPCTDCGQHMPRRTAADRCPECRCWTPDDQRPPQPANSSAGIRRLALQAAEAAVRDAKVKGGRT